MLRQFFQTAVLVLSLSVLVKGVYLFGIDRTVQNVLPPADYGLYFTLFNFSWLFQIFADFGLQNYNSRELAQARGRLVKYFPHLLLLKLALCGLYLLVVLGVGVLWGYERVAIGLLAMIGLNQALQSLQLYLRSNLAGLGFYRADSVVSVLDKAFVILICGGLLIGLPQFRIEYFVLSQTAAWLLTMGLTYGLLRSRLRGIRLQWRPRTLLVLLRRSAPFALVVFLMTIYTRIDAVMLERLHPEGRVEAAVYAMGYRLLDAANVFGFAVAGLLLPMFARQLAKREDVRPLLFGSGGAVLVVAVMAALVIGRWATEVITFLYVNGGPRGGVVLQYLMVAFVATSGGYVFGTFLTAAGKLRRLNGLFLLGILLNVGLNWWLIPTQGAIGAALATAGTQWLILGGQLLIASRMWSQPAD
jgi:O-antigen/teichoic acid export membrane protein